MSGKFSAWLQIGDLCELVGPLNECDKWRVGTECSITALGPPTGSDFQHHEYQFVTFDGLKGSCIRDHLRKKRPPQEYDGNAAGDWSLVPWRPGKVEA